MRYRFVGLGYGSIHATIVVMVETQYVSLTCDEVNIINN
jgi:hypothetical protein